jgi:hypothetical protein
MSERNFLKAAKTPDAKDDRKEWEGWYYAGWKRQFLGDDAAAEEYFRRCAAIKKVDVEVMLVHAELENLGSSSGGL